MLGIVTPTRLRWKWLVQQAEALAPQLGPTDHWVIVVDFDEPDQQALERIRGLVGERLTVAFLDYQRTSPFARVNQARNSGVALLPPHVTGIVELDDHDIISPDALSLIRHGLSDFDYVFGDYRQQAVIPSPMGNLLEPWPTVERTYKAGDFQAGNIEAIGLRAFRMTTWDRVGGWPLHIWPCADMAFAQHVEHLGLSVGHIPEVLSTVTIEPDSLSANFRGVRSE